MPQSFPITAWRHHRSVGLSNSLMSGNLQHIMQVPHALPGATSEDAEGFISSDPPQTSPNSDDRRRGGMARRCCRGKTARRGICTYQDKDSTSASVIVDG